MAVIKTTGLAKLLHQLGEDGVVISKVVHQQTDQQAAERTHQQGEQARVHAQSQGSFLPDPGDGSVDERHENKRDQGADDAQQGHQCHQPEITFGICLCIDHWLVPSMG